MQCRLFVSDFLSLLSFISMFLNNGKAPFHKPIVCSISSLGSDNTLLKSVFPDEASTIFHKAFKSCKKDCRFIHSVTQHILKMLEMFLWVLKLIHILPNSIVMCISQKTGKIHFNISFTIINYIDGDGDYEFPSMVISGIVRFQI